MANPTPLDSMDPEKRRRLENVVRHLLALVENQFWGTVQYTLKTGLIVNIRQEQTFDPSISVHLEGKSLNLGQRGRPDGQV